MGELFNDKSLNKKIKKGAKNIMTKQEKNKIENLLINCYGVSEDCINFATGIYGENEETYHNLLYYFTGYNSIDQIEDEEE